MSWEELAPPPPKAAAAKSEPVRVSMAGRRDSDPYLAIAISRDVIDLLGTAGRHYLIDLGSGEQRHLLRIRRDERGPFEARETKNPKTGEGSGTFRLRLPPLDRFPLCTVKAHGASYEYDKAQKALLITLPSWAWDDGSKARVEELARRQAVPKLKAVS